MMPKNRVYVNRLHMPDDLFGHNQQLFVSLLGQIVLTEHKPQYTLTKR